MLNGIGLACERGGRQLFNNLSFSIQPGEVLHLTGENGAGKTTLLRILCGLTLPSEGNIEWQDQDTNACREDFHSNLLYLGHTPGLHGDLTPTENLQQLCGLSQQTDETAITNALQKVGLANRCDVPAKYLSQGQKKRVSLARLLLSPANIWLLDEPFSALDVSAITWLNNHILQHCQHGGMVILTTHQTLSIEEQIIMTLEIGL